MSGEKSASKKRKRDASPESNFTLMNSSGQIGPLLVNYPTIEAPSSTSFRCYRQTETNNTNGGEHEAESLLVVGETKTIEFISNEAESKKVAESGCRYLVAAHNKRTGEIAVFPEHRSPYILGRTVKALKSLPLLDSPSKLQYLEAKNTLGETFGTKKQKANIRAQERNRIDVGAMEGVMNYVMDSIDKGAENLMTSEEMKETADSNRLIPQFDATTRDPADIYPLYNIIPEAEWKALSVSAFDEAQTQQERTALLAYRKSTWINDHLRKTAEDTGKARKRELKILLYISAMLAFRQMAFQKSIEKEKLYERLSAVPSIVADGLLSRFAETARGTTVYQSTSGNKTSLLTYMFALCLKLDKFATSPKIVAHDLSMSVSEVNQLFKTLGCKIQKLGEKERKKHGLSSQAADDKFAVLNAPVEFPKPRLRKK